MESYINSLLGAATDDPSTTATNASAAQDAVEAAGAVPILPFPFAKRSGAYVLQLSLIHI